MRALSEADIYNLYCLDVDDFECIGLAHIPDYNTSVMMNKLFRNIKENDNLDAIEESDDEADFENKKDDKNSKNIAKDNKKNKNSKKNV